MPSVRRNKPSKSRAFKVLGGIGTAALAVVGTLIALGAVKQKQQATKETKAGTTVTPDKKTSRV